MRELLFSVFQNPSCLRGGDLFSSIPVRLTLICYNLGCVSLAGENQCRYNKWTC
jgi:hypothetical protein